MGILRTFFFVYVPTQCINAGCRHKHLFFIPFLCSSLLWEINIVQMSGMRWKPPEPSLPLWWWRNDPFHYHRPDSWINSLILESSCYTSWLESFHIALHNMVFTYLRAKQLHVKKWTLRGNYIPTFQVKNKYQFTNIYENIKVQNIWKIYL